MRIRVSRKAVRGTVAVVGLLAAASALSGCSTFGMGGDTTVTGSTGYSGTSNLSQPMPAGLGASTRVADESYVPPENVGGSAPVSVRDYASLPPASSPSSISSQDLPVIGNTAPNGNLPAMSAQSNLAPLNPTPKAPLLATTTPAPNLTLVQGAAPAAGVYTHVIRSGESLYTIAKHYNVTAQAIMQASGIAAPDKIFVGQRVVIPGRPDLLAKLDGVQLAPAGSDRLPVDSTRPLAQSNPAIEALHAGAGAPGVHVASLGPDATSPVVPLAGRVLTDKPATILPPAHNALTGVTPAAKPAPVAAAKPGALPVAKPALTPSATPATTQVATAAPAAAPKPPLTDPQTSGAEKFRWPLTGKVIVDFASSKGTGINIAAPEGTPVRAVENGTVIYVGSGVEGYGNLILIRHSNGYVSAYANLKDMSVQKNAQVNRGDTIGTAGATGAVSSPQLHFELRKGATPVDPVPLLAAG